MSHALSRRWFLGGSSALLATGIAGSTRAKNPPRALPIPPLADGTDGQPIDMKIREGGWSFRPGVVTPTLGFNLDYLGPTIRTRRNSHLNLNYWNTLTEGVSVHGHGLHVPGHVDGGPQLEMPPGERWQPSLSIVQPAATCWYHAHTHCRTGHQVYHGLAGMIIIDDDDTDAMGLPNRYGLDDLPIIIQDRTFDEAGRLVYSLDEASEDGWLGDTVVINGAIAPTAKVPAGNVRLRILNGANARFYIVAFADNRTFLKIASDGGLLTAPVPMKSMEMAPGERCEIIVDLSDGRPAALMTLFEDELEGDFEDALDEAEMGEIGNLLETLKAAGLTLPPPSLTLETDTRLMANRTPLPGQLATVPRPHKREIVRTREFFLGMEGLGHSGHCAPGSEKSHAAMTINDAVMDMGVINERVKRGVWERWRVRADKGAHPFHVHGCSFLIDRMEGEDAPADQQGWKDTIVLDDDDWSEFLVRFDHLADEQHPYMYHCHILEHEDHGMMGQFTVS